MSSHLSLLRFIYSIFPGLCLISFLGEDSLFLWGMQCLWAAGSSCSLQTDMVIFIILEGIFFSPQGFLSQSYLGLVSECMSVVCLQLFSQKKKSVWVPRLRWWWGPQKTLGGNQELAQTRATKTNLNNGLLKAQLYPKAAAAPGQLSGAV